MLQVVGHKQVSAFHDRLKEVFKSSGHEIHRRRLSTPGGAFDASLSWNPAIGLWAHFPANPFDGSRWACWFGTTIGEPNETLYPSIEINLPLDPSYRQVAGRTLVDEDGQLFLGHKGGLGGGRGGQMAIREFAELIQGFVREPILLSEEREERVFVIGALEAEDFQDRLLSYVKECERLRAFAKSRAAEDPEGTLEDDEEPSEDAYKGGSFSPEFDIDGTGSGGPTDRRSIRRLHGRVVNALQRELGPEAINCTKFEMRPDLYLRGPGNRMEVLFEVKAFSNTQSWFTALGQLVVYGAMQSPPPRRVLVCPAPLKSSSFQRALAHLNITLVTFEVNRSRIVFHGLNAVRLPVPA